MPGTIESHQAMPLLARAAAGETLEADQARTAARFALRELAQRHPGRSVEVRVPFAGAVQILPGPSHRRGTPPNVVEMARAFPHDPGIAAALLLNPVTLRRGEALFVPAGSVHAYISGLGVEIMASSDNVLRAGLTTKHVDVPAMLACVDYVAAPPVRPAPEYLSRATRAYYAPVDDFELLVTTVVPQDGRVPVPGRGPRILLGLERVSLQAEIAEILGYGLAKEHSMADWSQRPLGPELRAYAALDVELLLELRNALMSMLRAAGRLEWLHEECEEIRLREPKPPRAQPWRKAARQVGVRDRRALGMLAALWDARDGLAKDRDLAPERVLPSKVMAELAARKPRSRSDVERSPLLQSRIRRKDVDVWWAAVEGAWALDGDALPERQFHEGEAPYPAVRNWERTNPQAAQRWRVVRTAVLARADDLGIRQERLLNPPPPTGYRKKALDWVFPLSK